MSYFQTQDQKFHEPECFGAPGPPEYDDADRDEPGQLRSPGARLADFRVRIARAVSGFDRGPADVQELQAGLPVPEGLVDPESPGQDALGRFPVGPFGYNRAAVDQHVADLEHEIAELRRELPGGMTINEEIERIGEQTASILVVAHDQAKETKRRAQEQADRCVADAASSAVAMTEKAERRLREIDNETDAVWQERARLLEDARATGDALIGLARAAAERFPEDAERFPEDAERFPEDAERFPEDTERVPHEEKTGETQRI